MIALLDNRINKITMYRLVLYYLMILLTGGLIFGTLGYLPFSPVSLIESIAIILISGIMANQFFAKLFGAATNMDSVYITSLILALIVSPASSTTGFLNLAIISILAIASKYLFVVKRKHVFNPAAIAIVLSGLLFGSYASWWVGTIPMMPLVLFGGIILTRRIRRSREVAIFTGSYLLILASFYLIQGKSFEAILSNLQLGLIRSALLFFAFVMFTEPVTSPATERLRFAFAVIVAMFYTTAQTHLFGLALTPEMALCSSNLIAFILNPRYKYRFKLIHSYDVAKDTIVFILKRPIDFEYQPGQFMEWTLPHKNSDSRGIRRYFSIASSPTDDKVALAVRYNHPVSSFKKALRELSPGQEIIGSELGGDFVLPRDPNQKICFIAGGIGIAPFRSMTEYLLDKKQFRDIKVLYINRDIDDIAFIDDLEKAKRAGVATEYFLTSATGLPSDWKGRTGRIKEQDLIELVPDIAKRLVYISGPPAMVDGTKKLLNELRVPRHAIKLDYFAGY